MSIHQHGGKATVAEVLLVVEQSTLAGAALIGEDQSEQCFQWIDFYRHAAVVIWVLNSRDTIQKRSSLKYCVSLYLVG